MIYQKIKSRLFNNHMLGTLLWSFYSSDKSSCKSASIMMIFVIQETTQNYLSIVFVSILICIIIIPTRRWVGHSGLNPKKSAIFFKGMPHFLPYFSTFRALGGASLNCTLHVVIKMHYTAAAHAQFMCYFVQKKNTILKVIIRLDYQVFKILSALLILQSIKCKELQFVSKTHFCYCNFFFIFSRANCAFFVDYFFH